MLPRMTLSSKSPIRNPQRPPSTPLLDPRLPDTLPRKIPWKFCVDIFIRSVSGMGGSRTGGTWRTLRVPDGKLGEHGHPWWHGRPWETPRIISWKFHVIMIWFGWVIASCLHCPCNLPICPTVRYSFDLFSGSARVSNLVLEFIFFLFLIRLCVHFLTICHSLP